ncbi:MAG: metal-dependent transcriptional regulator [Peptococcaceae bacterium]|nr:metal-dependent transcriptional regulator [Peptococcaceae bacterium]
MAEKTASIDHYLKAIYQIQKEKGIARHVEIAEELGVSKPSVTRAIRVLKDLGYVKVFEREITLTESGEEEAKKLWNNYKTICKYLVSLGVPEDSASQDACTLEHSISDETYSLFRERVIS